MFLDLPDMTHQELSGKIIGAAIEVHRELGPGLLEGIYERCLVMVLREKGLRVEQQVAVPVHFRGQQLGANLRLDLIVDGRIIVEVKAVEFIHDSHKAQTLTYLKMTGCKLGLVINFGQRLLKEGVERVVNGLDEEWDRFSLACRVTTSTVDRGRLGSGSSSPGTVDSSPGRWLRRNAPLTTVLPLPASFE